MAIDTKLMVDLDIKDPAKIIPLVTKGIIDFSKSTGSPLSEQDITSEIKFQKDDIESISFYFNIKEEKRWLFCCFTTFNNKDFPVESQLKPAISFSLGRWGVAEELMFYIGMKFSEFAPSYFLPSDVKSKYEPLHFFTELIKGYLKFKVSQIE